MWPLLLPKDFGMRDDLYLMKKVSGFQLFLDWAGSPAGYSYDAEYISYNDPETPGRRRRQKKNKRKE